MVNVRSVSRAAKILICLSEGITNVTDIAKHCNISKSTTHRLLKTLVKSDLVAEDSRNHIYGLGYLIAKLSLEPLVAHESLTIFTTGEMKRLSEVTGETVALNVMHGLQIMKLHELNTKSPLQIIEEEKIFPMFVAAPTKALLSLCSEKKLEEIFTNLKLTKMTQRTIVDKKLLISQISQIRDQGYAISYGEKIMGGACLAVPIKDYVCPATIMISGPEIRIRPKESYLLKELLASTRIIEEKLHQHSVENSISRENHGDDLTP